MAEKDKPKKERRRHGRAAPPAIVLVIDGTAFPTRDLSVGGALIDAYDGPLTPGALLTVTGIGPADDVTTASIRARVNRSEDGGRRLAMTFLDLDAKAFNILRLAMAARQQGMALPETPDPMAARPKPARTPDDQS